MGWGREKGVAGGAASPALRCRMSTLSYGNTHHGHMCWNEFVGAVQHAVAGITSSRAGFLRLLSLPVCFHSTDNCLSKATSSQSSSTVKQPPQVCASSSVLTCVDTVTASSSRPLVLTVTLPMSFFCSHDCEKLGGDERRRRRRRRFFSCRRLHCQRLFKRKKRAFNALSLPLSVLHTCTYTYLGGGGDAAADATPKGVTDDVVFSPLKPPLSAQASHAQPFGIAWHALSSESERARRAYTYL